MKKIITRCYFMSKSTIGIIFTSVIVLGSFAFIQCTEKRVTLDITPEELYQKLLSNPHIKEFPRGGQFAWYASKGMVYYRPHLIWEGPGGQSLWYASWNATEGMGQFLNCYKETKDTSWLDTAVKYYDFVMSRMDKDPDGYVGFFGSYGKESKYWTDDFFEIKFFSELLSFSKLVLDDESLKNKYGDKAESYIKLAKNCIEKWDKRGCWYQEEPYGMYVSFSQKYLTPNDLNEWKYFDNPRRSTSSFNVITDIAQLCIRIYGLTGDNFYRNKADKIFLNVKRRFQYFDDHYVWNYWEPFGIWDLDIERKQPKSSVGLHPYRSEYDGFVVQKIVEAYHFGIVFDEQDMKRIINTNLNVMWNKDLNNPEFFNLDGSGTEKDTTGIGAFRQNYGPSNDFKNQGELWTGLLDFDQTIRDIYSVQLKNYSEKLEIFKKWSNENPPSFERKYIKEKVNIPEMDFTECRCLSMAAVLPHIIEKGKKSVIICKSLESGELEISLYSKDGKNKIKTLHKDSIEGYKGISSREGIFMITWDGTDPDKKENYKGDYKIRWSFKDKYREFPIFIK